MKLALLQMRAAAGDAETNLAAIEAAAETAAAQGAELLIVPELAVTGYGAGEARQDLAEPADGPQVARLAAPSERLGLAIVAGFAERNGAAVYNALVLLRPGEAPVVYRKSHLYGDYERAHFTSGEVRPVMADFKGLKLGFLICYDVEFPENVRRLARAGAEIILVPTALPAGANADFIARQMLPVRAFENQVFIAYADHGGGDTLFSYAGLSRICAPDGSLLAASEDDAETLLFAELDPAAYDDSRAANTYLRDLRSP
jgi:predicted amidohydrolase